MLNKISGGQADVQFIYGFGDVLGRSGGGKGEGSQEQVESLQTRVAYREALVSLRTAQRHLARHEGVRGADVNRVLAGEIEAAIREIHTVGTWEFDHESQGWASWIVARASMARRWSAWRRLRRRWRVR